MKILYFSQAYLAQGGGEKNILQLVKNLQKSDDLFLLAPMSRSYFQKIQQFKVKIFKTSPSSLFNISAFFIISRLRKILKNQKIEILHTMSPKARLFAVIAKKGLKIKLVHTVHSSPFLYQKGKIKGFFYKRIEKFLNQKTDQIIFVSENTKNLFLKEKILPFENWTVIYNGLDLNYSQKFLKNKKEIRKQVIKEYHLKDNYLITFVGRFSFEKGLIYLVEAAKSIINILPQTRFILIGDGPEKKNIINKIKQDNLEKYFILPGFQEEEEVYKISVASHIFVLPSFYETFSYTVCQAMSLGLAIVATEVGGIRELIKNGFNGFLIQPGKSEDISKAVVKILKNKDLALKFSQNNLKKVQGFKEEKMIQAIKNIYQ
ncbi:glycosyltransferase [Patescibacteria group bacterium]|nr:glycosyltransferase [Patescibacteria group bacterium]